MSYAKILDCTLRDGAYLIDKRFGDNAIHGIIKGLMKAKTDFIEIGFFQDEGFGEGKTVLKTLKMPAVLSQKISRELSLPFWQIVAAIQFLILTTATKVLWTQCGNVFLNKNWSRL